MKDYTPDIRISDYTYDLPPERIAKYPLAERDDSRLLVYNNGEISESRFRSIASLLPESSLLICNQSKVVFARLVFHKSAGAEIEIFCLEPVSPSSDFQVAFARRGAVVWKCLVKNSKKWKTEHLEMSFRYNETTYTLQAERQKVQEGISWVEFTWTPNTITFSEVLSCCGMVPIPPYLKRKAESVDPIRYQTIYATREGSVAAPTAGLHFSEDVLNRLQEKRITIEHITLHVGAGTFRPVKEEKIASHEMHTEKIIIERDTIQSILEQANKKRILVGTTTVRTLESLYWHGVKLLVNPHISPVMNIRQWDSYDPSLHVGIGLHEALKAVISSLDSTGTNILTGKTQLMIVPGYAFKSTDILITNFHMPGSTLLLLIAAFLGEPWKKAYRYAIEKGFRFLSYGDACLFFASDKQA